MRLGSDVDRLDGLVLTIRRHVSVLQATGVELRRATDHLAWIGPDRNRFEVSQAQIHRSLAEVSTTLERAGADLDGQAAAQRRASNAGATLFRSNGPQAAPRRETLLWSAADGGRAIVAIGDVRAADHIAVVVPGIGTDLSDLDRLVRVAELLQRAASNHSTPASAATDRPETVAVIAWLGYDTPAGTESPLRLHEALRIDRAHRGSVALRTFVTELSEAQRADITLIGHSYGSLVVAGAAAANPDVDRVVVLGSPGLGFEGLGDLDLATGTELFAAAAAGDLVAASEWFGPNPADPAFGAQRLTTGTPAGSKVSAHSSYLAEGSVTLDAIAALVAGAEPQPGTVIPP